MTVDSVIMADGLAGQTANLHLDEVTGERVRSVPDPTHLACGFTNKPTARANSKSASSSASRTRRKPPKLQQLPLEFRRIHLLRRRKATLRLMLVSACAVLIQGF